MTNPLAFTALLLSLPGMVHAQQKRLWSLQMPTWFSKSIADQFGIRGTWITR